MRMKRSTAVLLMLALCVTLLPTLRAGAADTMADRQNAVKQTAYAYYYKGHSMQYDGTQFSSVSGTSVALTHPGAKRLTTAAPPEYATPDQTMYSVCSDFAFQVYYAAFGYPLIGSQGNCWTAALASPLSQYVPDGDPRLVYRWEKPQTATASDWAAAVSALISQAQMGDIITVQETSKTSNGHTMVYIGDDKVLHCFGVKYSMSTGEEGIELAYGQTTTDYDNSLAYHAPSGQSRGGAIRLTTASSYLKSSSCGGVTDFDHLGRVTLLRPLNTIDADAYPISSAAKVRMSLPYLTIDRTIAETTRYKAVQKGDTITLTVTLRNNTATYAYPAFDVTETIPEGVEFVDASGSYNREGNTVTWHFTQLAKQTTYPLTITYRVTAERGETIVFDGGAVTYKGNSIPSNTIPLTVGGKKLTAEENAKLAGIAGGAYDAVLSGATDATLAQVVYTDVLGLEGVEIPAYNTVPQKVMSSANPPAQNGSKITVLTNKETFAESDRFVSQMVVPGFFGGKGFWTADNDKRALETRYQDLEPGDIVVRLNNALNPTACRTLIYLGNKQFLQRNASTGNPEIVSNLELVKSHTYGLFYCLRPTQAYDDIHNCGQPQIEADTAETKADGSVDVTITLANNPGIVSARLSVQYPEGLTLEKVTGGNALKDLTFATPDDLTANPVILNWNGQENDWNGGTLVTLTFRAPQEMPEGTYPVTVTCEEGDVLTKMQGGNEAVALLFQDGAVKVHHSIAGDVNGDKIVNPKDITALRRYIGYWKGSYAEETVIDEIAADTDGSGEVGYDDITQLRKYLAGGYGVNKLG